MAGDEKVQIIINFDDDLDTPFFPEPFADRSREHPDNVTILHKAETLINDIYARRQAGYAALTLELSHFKAVVLDKYWLSKSLLVDIPFSSVKAISERDDVLYVEPRYG